MNWIKSKDRLPKDNEYVLLVINGVVDLGFIWKTIKIKDKQCFKATLVFEDNYCTQVFTHKNVSHWMPLPKPPAI